MQLIRQEHITLLRIMQIIMEDMVAIMVDIIIIGTVIIGQLVQAVARGQVTVGLGGAHLVCGNTQFPLPLG